MTQFNAALRRCSSGVVPGWSAAPKGAVSRLVTASGNTPMQTTAGRRGRGRRAKGNAPTNMVSATITSAGNSRRMAESPANCPGEGSRKISRRSAFTPRSPRRDVASRSGLATIRSWASHSGASATNRAPVAVTLSR